MASWGRRADLSPLGAPSREEGPVLVLDDRRDRRLRQAVPSRGDDPRLEPELITAAAHDRGENLVADLEAESRRLIEFLGLDWEPGCLDFHRTERTVATVSHWQVRQRLYSNSVGRWRNYEKHLAPLLAALNDSTE